jgi:protein TonB
MNDANETKLFPWALAAALVVWLGCMTVFGKLFSHAEPDDVPPLPVDARIVELPEPQQPPPRPQTAPPQPPSAPRHISRPAHQAPAKPTPQPSPSHETSPASPIHDSPAPIAKTSPAAEPPHPTPAPAAPPTPSPSNTSSGAKATYRPTPKIPDELRDEAVSARAVVRFHIQADGSTQAELLTPTSNPRLNRLILNTLKTWKFSPALQNGQPVASTQDVNVQVDVN